MTNLKLSAISYSLNQQPFNIKDWKERLFSEIQTQLNEGIRVILYPEYFWLGITQYFETRDPTEQNYLVAEYVWEKFLPELQERFKQEDFLLVLGTAPRKQDGVLYNSAPIINCGKLLHQDKLYMTPWEEHFHAGRSLKIFDFCGLRTAVLICFDIEQPALAQKLKDISIDLILAPSAVINRNGSQRVNRCASSRSVELGAAVLTCPLIGQSLECEMVDHNEGRQGFFLPAQEDVTVEQEVYSSYTQTEHVQKTYELDLKMLRDLKTPTFETKPYLKGESEHSLVLL